MKTKNIIYLLCSICCLSINTATAQGFEWAKAFGGQGIERNPHIANDTSGNNYVVGYFDDVADVDPGPNVFNLIPEGGTDIFILKLDSDGNFIWAKSVGGTDSEQHTAITLDASGNIYITGYFQGTVDFDPNVGVNNLVSAGSLDIFILKLDTNGDFVWAKRMGSTGIDFANDIVIDTAGDVFTIGSFSKTVDFHPGLLIYNLTSAGDEDIFISKLNADGEFKGATRIGGTSEDRGLSITIDTAGNIYTTGYFEGTVDFDPASGASFLLSSGFKDGFILKLDMNRNYQWVKQIGGSLNDYSNSINLDATGNVYTTGYFEGIVDFNPGVGTLNYTSAGDSDVYVLKLNTNGGFLWAKRIGGVGNDYSSSVILDTSSNVYITGIFEDTVDFDPSLANTYNITSTGFTDIFVTKLNGLGDFQWANKLGGSGSENTSFITFDVSENLYTAGDFTFSADFDPGVGSNILTSIGNTDIFIQKLSNTSLSVDNTFKESLTAFPNPTNKKSTINLGDFYNDITLNVRTVTGQLVDTKKYTSKNSIDFSINGSSGLYFAEIIADDKKAALKIIKQ